MKKALIYSTAFVMAFASSAQAGLLYNYSQLTIKDLDQMTQLVTDKVKESQKTEDGKTVPLKEALQAVFARPNRDGMIDRVVGPLRSALDSEDAWEETLTALTSEAINALKNPKAFKPINLVTYQIFLENMLSEMKPYLAGETFEKGLVVQIRDAKIELTKEIISERKVRLMEEAVSPSETARKLIEAAEKAKPTVSEPAAK